MKYLSVCSGVEAATVAWHPLGWQPVAFSEIEPFPSAVLAHHYPNVPNVGDMTKYKEWNLNESIDLLVGGTPCQSFSVAGLRKGLEDPRGNLALVYLGIADHYKPKWLVWENVPGVLSSSKGRDFGSFLGALVELGYGFAYRVLDAQYFGVPQRRRRVFVVAHLGDWRPAAAVLFERESLLGNPKKSGRAGTRAPIGTETRSPDGSSTIGSLLARDYKGIGNQDLKDGRTLVLEPFTGSGFADYKNGVGTLRNSGGDLGGGSETLIAKVYENHPADSRVKEMGNVCTTVTSRWGTGGGNVPFALAENTIGRQPLNGGNGTGYTDDNTMYTLNATGVHGIAYGFEPGITKREGNPSRFVEEGTPTLRADMGDNQMATAHAFKMRGGCEGGGKGYLGKDELAFTLSTHQDQQIAVGFNTNARPDEMKFLNEKSNTLTRSQNSGIYHEMAVRRLTPVECERLQGFPDNYTNIPWRKKEESPDGPRYKAMGNSMAVPVMNWIGKRIQMVDDLL
jgi:DNA (cytosine-5)-methyltransferase 1